MERWAAALQQAGRQHHVLGAWQAAEHGIGTTALAAKVEQAGWIRLRRGVYLVAPGRRTTEAEIIGVVIGVRDPVVAAGRAATYLWGLTDRLRDLVEIAVPDDRDVAPRNVRVRNFTHFERLLTTQRSSIVVPVVEHTLCLVAATATVDELVRLISTAHRKRRTDPSRVHAAMADLGPFKGIKKLRVALRRLDQELTHSGLERLGRAHLRAAGFRPHPKPYTVVDAHGRFVAEVDIPFIPERIAVEVYGAPHEGQQQADEDRRRRLEREGWIVIVVYEQRLREQPTVFISQVRDAFAQRLREAGAA